VRNLKSVHVEVYVFRRRRRRVEFLCLRRSKKKTLPGVWQPVTGKRRTRERAAAAAWREVVEETGAKPVKMWALESVTVFFEGSTNVARALPLFAAEIRASSRVKLSKEHDAYRFEPAGVAGRLYLWESQRRGLDAVKREVLSRPKLARALELKISKPTRA
jgi:8-oxo-dGTP pyrophosphatase MutT (NUDIX family)